MRCRRDYRDLTEAEKSLFIEALYDAKERGVIDAFANEHDIHFDHGHFNSTFLPWHREFLRLFELELQKYDPRVMLCYWNSSEDQSTDSELWSDDFLGQFDDEWNLGRALGAEDSLASPGTVADVLRLDAYDQFRPRLESDVHNGPHNWIGGKMATGFSPSDPAFFLHHCYIDMLWAQWQLRYPDSSFIADDDAPDVGGAMHPWSTTVGDMLDHRAINVYAYPPEYIQDDPRVEPAPSSPPSITFAAVPEGLTFLSAALFQVDACENLTFNIGTPVVDSGPDGTEFTRAAASIVVDPHVEPTGRVWIFYKGTAAGDHATGHVDVTCEQTGETWVVPIAADVISKPKAAIALLLDQSNSMNDDSGIGPGIHRSDVLRFSAPPCIDVLDDDHAVTVISFDHDPHELQPLTEANVAGRLALNSAIGGYDPNEDGWTAIGEAVNFAHQKLEDAAGYDVKATVVLTDGKEEHGPHDRLSLGEISVNERVFAIGLGTPANINPDALQALCNGNEGYMLITGALNPDAYFRLAKYYQQIIAGVTNQDVVLDPEGIVRAGEVVRIPFYLTEADIVARAILLTDNPKAVIFGLETPAGQIIRPTTSHPMIQLRVGEAVEMYRTTLPLPIGNEKAHVGKWHALIGIEGTRYSKTHSTHTIVAGPSKLSARYNLNIHAQSNLRMRASLSQSSNEPGANIFLRVSLTEYAIPLTTPAKVRAELVRPDDTSSVITFFDAGEGTYEASLPATQLGVYRFRIIVKGTTSRARPFTREQTLTGAIWSGGDRPAPSPKDPNARWCHVVRCLLKQQTIRELMKKYGIDADALTKCLLTHCRPKAREDDKTKSLKALFKDDAAVRALAEALKAREQEDE